MPFFKSLLREAGNFAQNQLTQPKDGGEGGGGGGGGFDLSQISGIIGSATGSQQGNAGDIMSMITSGGGDMLKSFVENKGVDPSLTNGVTELLKGVGGSGGGFGGFDPNMLLKMATTLAKGGPSGGPEGLLQMAAAPGEDGEEGGTMQNLLNILMGLGKSYFNIKGKSNGKTGQDIQSWESAGANYSGNKNFIRWAINLIRSLIFPGSKPKEIIESGEDENIDIDKKTEDDKDGIKGWYDDHPEIGKMQDEVIDGILDNEDDEEDEDDPSPIVPTPQDAEEGCTGLDNAAILFLNTNLLLDYRKNWRFLYSTKSHSRSMDEFLARICYKGPTIIVVKDTDGHMFGAHASSSWCNTEDGWIGNGESFLFSIVPKMAVFDSTGKDENFMRLNEEGLAMGGSQGNFGLSISSDLESGECSGDIDTFATIQLAGAASFQIMHLEVWGLGPEPDEATEMQNTSVRKPNMNIRGGYVDMGDLASQIF